MGSEERDPELRGGIGTMGSLWIWVKQRLEGKQEEKQSSGWRKWVEESEK